MKVYGITQETSQTIGHGSSLERFVMCDPDPYGNNLPPIFINKEDAENHMKTILIGSPWLERSIKIVELDLIE